MSEDEQLLSLEEVARLTGAPPNFVVQALDRDGIKPVDSGGGWVERHKSDNLRWRRQEIESWLARQEGGA